MSRQSPPPPGRDGPWPAQGGRPQGRPQGGQGPAAPTGPPNRQYGPADQNGRPQQPPPTSGGPAHGTPNPAQQSQSSTGQPPQNPARQAPPPAGGPPRSERPTAFIPKVDETEFIPKVEDFGAVSQGRTPTGFPTVDPDAYQPRHGSFTEPPAAATSIVPVVSNDIGTRLDGVAGRPSVGRRRVNPDDEQTDYFDTDLTSQFAKDFATQPAYSPGLDSGYTDADSVAGESPVGPPPARGRGRTTVRTLGEVLITAGMVVLLFVVYELYITDIFSAQKQANATTALDHEWDTVGASRSNHYDLTDGSGLAKLYVPAFGQDYVFTVIVGDSQADLAVGPGWYPGSALPGERGDFAIAGHRVGEGAPFDDLGLLQSCDAILIETQTDWYVYRVLPMSNEVSDWSTDRGRTAQCSGPNGENAVQPLTGLYSQTVGQEIVLPTEGDVVAPVPHHLGANLPASQELPLLTLTTCNPKFSSAQRMIIHAIMVKDWKKTPGTTDKMPPEMKETS